MLKAREWLTLPLVLYSLVLTLVMSLALFAAASLPEGYNQNAGYDEAWMLEGYWSIWLRWDTEWYVEIARKGYDYIPNTSSEIGYFPVYPHLMRWLSPLFGNPIAAGMVISHLCLLGALMLLYRLTLDETGDVRIARRTILYLLLYPAALFLFAPYTESLFLLLSLEAVWLAREKRWFWASVLGMIASATRVQGFFVMSLVGMVWLNQHGYFLKQIHKAETWRNLQKGIVEDWRSLVWISFIPSGLIAFIIFQGVVFGNPFAFIESHSTIASNTASNPISVIWHEIQWTLRGENPDPWIVPLGISALLFALVSLPAMVKRLPEPYFVYVVLMLALPMWTGPVYGITRYVVVLFPVFMIWASWGSNSKWLHLLYLSIAPVLLCLAVIFHIRWLFVA